MNGKTYYWCNEHQLWCLHKPEECLLKIEKESGNKNQNKENKENQHHEANLANTDDDELTEMLQILEGEEKN